MSNTGVHDFQIPHERVRPTRDMVVIRMPRPPKRVGSIQLPDMMRDVAQFNVMAGRIVSMGPLAFSYKDGNGATVKQEVNIGDWVVIRPYAGTMVQNGQVVGAGGCRYVSSFQDVIAVIPSDAMPDPDTLLWDDEDPHKSTDPVKEPGFDFHNARETVTTSGA